MRSQEILVLRQFCWSSRDWWNQPRTQECSNGRESILAHLKKPNITFEQFILKLMNRGSFGEKIFQRYLERRTASHYCLFAHWLRLVRVPYWSSRYALWSPCLGWGNCFDDVGVYGFAVAGVMDWIRKRDLIPAMHSTHGVGGIHGGGSQFWIKGYQDYITGDRTASTLTWWETPVV